MPVGIQIVRKEKGESAFDKVLKGVQLANTIVGTVGGIQSLAEKSQASELAKQQSADAQGGVYTQKELDNAGFVTAKEGEMGAMARKLRMGDQVSDVLVKKYEKSGDPLETDYKKAQIAKLNAEAKNVGKQGDPATTEFKQNQYAAAGFANRAMEAESLLGQMTENGFKAPEWRPLDRFRPEAALPQEVKKYNQIKNNFVSAVLRDESGASISKEERAEAERMYFPQEGDGDEVLAQKAQARADAVASLRAEAGGAIEQVRAQRGIMGLVAGEKPRDQYKSLGKDSQRQAPAPTKELTAKDKQALAWANANLADPVNGSKAAQILKLHGGGGKVQARP
jgi:hypothetical protein